MQGRGPLVAQGASSASLCSSGPSCLRRATIPGGNGAAARGVICVVKVDNTDAVTGSALRAADGDGVRGVILGMFGRVARGRDRGTRPNGRTSRREPDLRRRAAQGTGGSCIDDVRVIDARMSGRALGDGVAQGEALGTHSRPELPASSRPRLCPSDDGVSAHRPGTSQPRRAERHRPLSSCPTSDAESATEATQEAEGKASGRALSARSARQAGASRTALSSRRWPSGSRKKQRISGPQSCGGVRNVAPRDRSVS